MSSRGFVEGTIPCRVNPTSETRLKMAGRGGDEKVAERVGNPVSDTVAGGVGPVGGIPGQSPGELGRATGRAVESPSSYALKGQETPGEVPSIERSRAGTSGQTV